MQPENPLKKLVIVGAGGFGREVLDVVEARNRTVPTFDVVGFVDDSPAHPERIEARGTRLLSGFDDPAAAGAEYLIGIGDPAARRAVAARAEAAGLQPASVRHPSASFGAENEIGAGFIACAQVALTTNVRLGRHVHLNLTCTVGHDCVFGDFVTVNPGANISGDVRLGDDVTIGTGASVIQGVTIGARTIVGAGAVVTRDLPEGVVAVGAPARPR